MSKQHSLNEKKLFETLEKCGFELEHYVHGLLREYQWNVINNRSYIDDTTEKEREIDLVAYKYKEVDGVWYFTVLVISCKQSTHSEWAFLTQERKTDVNFNYNPIHLVTSDNEHRNMVKNEWDSYVQHVKTSSSLVDLYSSDSRVFANLQFNKQSYNDEGNQRIYASISSTIKAMEAEKDSHKDTKLEGKPVLYTFYALSIFNKPFIEIKYSDDGKKSIHVVNELKYINRHIVNRKENFYLVHFICKGVLEDSIKAYDDIHNSNIEYYANLRKDFYSNIWNHKHRIEMVKKEFISRLSWMLYVITIGKDDLIWLEGQEVVEMSFSYANELLTMDAMFKKDLDEDLLLFFNTNDNAKKRIGDLLLKYFHYKGKYEITNDYLPF
ncbi:MAG: hypothetical protein ACOX62_09325 [Christensenellales bacterium]|jgi:hypothetical protein